MVKKESTKRGYMTVEEIKEKIKGGKIKNLQETLYRGQFLMHGITRRNGYEALGQLQLEMGLDESKSRESRKSSLGAAIYNFRQGHNSKNERKTMDLMEQLLGGKYGERVDDKPIDYEKWKSRSLKSIAIFSFGASLFFLSPVLTGNAIGTLTNSTTNYLGAGLIVLGLIGAYFWKKK